MIVIIHLTIGKQGANVLMSSVVIWFSCIPDDGGIEGVSRGVPHPSCVPPTHQLWYLHQANHRKSTAFRISVPHHLDEVMLLLWRAELQQLGAQALAVSGSGTPRLLMLDVQIAGPLESPREAMGVTLGVIP